MLRWMDFWPVPGTISACIIKTTPSTTPTTKIHILQNHYNFIKVLFGLILHHDPQLVSQLHIQYNSTYEGLFSPHMKS